ANFAIRLYRQQRRVIACDGRLVISIVDAAYGMEHTHARFGLSGYSIRPHDEIDHELELLADAEVIGTAALPAVRQTADTMIPTLTRLRDLDSSAISINGIDLDFAGQI